LAWGAQYLLDNLEKKECYYNSNPQYTPSMETLPLQFKKMETRAVFSTKKTVCNVQSNINGTVLNDQLKNGEGLWNAVSNVANVETN
jgi:hypothetical protein